MPDLKQSLKDFVATSNSGKYNTEEELMSKFPELKGYDIQSLKDFVATSNSGKYSTEDEIFSKFPEFGFTSEETLKKKEQTQSPMEANVSGTTELPSENTSSVSPKPFDKNALLNKGLKQATIATPLENVVQNRQETKDISEMKAPTNLTSLHAINNAAQEKLKAAQEKANLRQQIINYQAANPQTKGGGFDALNDILIDPNAPEQSKLAAKKQIDNVNKYIQLDEKVNELNAHIDKHETIRQKGLEEKYGSYKNFTELVPSFSLKMFTGTAKMFNSLGLNGDTETTDTEINQEAKAQSKENLKTVDDFANTLITQETPEEWKKSIFSGRWDANRVGYFLSQALGQTVPTAAAGLLMPGAAASGATAFGAAAILGAGLGYNESYDAFKETGLTDRQAELASTAIAIPLGILEQMGLSDIVTKPLFKLMLKETTKDVVAALAKKELTNEGLFEAVKATFGQKIKEYGKELLEAGIKEPLTEMEQALLSEVGVQTAEAYTGKDSNAKQTMFEYLKDLGLRVSEEGAYGLAGGVGLSAVTAAVQNRANPTAYGRALELKDDELMSSFKSQLKREVAKGIITADQAATAIKNVHRIQVADSKIPSTVVGNEKRSQVASLLGIKEALQNEIEGKDKSLTGPVQAAVADIDVKLNEIATGKEEENAPKASGVLANTETTTAALEALPTEEKEKTTFTDNEGTVVPVAGNEKKLSDIFHEAKAVPEEERTESQQSAIDAVEVSLKTPLDLESEVARLQEEFPMSEAEQGIVAPTIDTGVSASSNNNLSPFLSNDIKDRIDYNEKKIKEAQEKEKKKGIGKKILDLGGIRSWENHVAKWHQEKVRLLKENPLAYYQEELNAVEKIKEKTKDDQDYIEYIKEIITELEQSKSNNNKSSLSNIKGKQTDATKIKVIESAEKAVKTLKSIFPNFDMIVHEDEGSYNAAVQKEKGTLGTSGNFSVRRNAEGKIVGGRIDINLSKATSTTVAHEVAHSVLLHAFGDNPALFKTFRNNISKVLKADTNKKLTEFANQYTNEEVQPEEYLVQLTALMEQEQENISTTTYQKIAALINKLVSTLTAGQVKVFEDIKNTKDLIDFLNTTSKAIRGGEEITTKGIKEQKGTTSTSRSQVINKANTVKDIDVKSIRMLSRAGKRVSKGLSVKTVNNKKEVSEAEDLSIDYVKENAPKIYIANANIIAQYPIVEGIKKIKNVETIEQAKEVYDIFIRQVADNLKYLMDNFNKEFRDVSTLWYDGANILAQNFSEKYGVSEEQAAGIIAAMSPQKDWYQNVRLAEMVMMAFKENPIMTNDMIKKQILINTEGLKPLNKKIKNAQKAYDLSKTKVNKEKLDSVKKDLVEKTKKADKIIEYLKSFIGKKMNSIPNEFKCYYTRLWNEINTTKDYDVLRPDGKVMGIAMNKDGVTKSKVAWGSYTEIGKAVSIYVDGSQENITKTLGEMHKIRNFYNNIIDPMSPDKDVTMDTHAIAAALLMPLSGNTKQVGQNFGTGTSNSSPLGIKGLYYAYAEAYNLAAEEENLLPRQVQSITWEAVRGLFTDVFKSKAENVKKIDEIWDKYTRGEININEARNEISKYAGGIKDPTWSGPFQEGSRSNVESGNIGGGDNGTRPTLIGKSTNNGGTINDKENITGLQSNLGKGKESKQAESNKGAGKEKTSTGRNVQAYEEEVGTPTSKSQKLDNEYAESSGTTQRNNTIPSYIRAAEKLKSLGVKGSVLDYGAGLGLGSDAMNEVLGKNVDSYEINPEKWEGKVKVKYTNSEDINKKYDAIVSLNVVNVVPKDVRDFIIKDIFNHLKDGGTAIISSRAFSNDIANSKKFKVAKEEKAYIINQKEKGKAVNVYQKGYDGDEFFDYVKDLLGDKAKIKKVDSEYGKKGVIIRKTSEVSSGTPTSKSQVVSSKTKITLSNKFTNVEGATDAVNEIKQLGEVNQLNDKQVIIDGVKINVERDGGKILLKEITAIEQGKGAGTKVLKQIQDIANDNGIDIILYPTKIKNTSEEQLNKWYKKNGFEDYTQGRLIYTPTSKSQVASEVKELEQSFPLSKAQQKAVNAINKIIKDARSQGFSEEAIKAFLESKGLTSQEATEAMAAETSASKKVVLSEETMPGYDRMMQQVDGIIEKSEARGVDKAKTLQNVIDYVQGSKAYENATDVQREKLIRDINKMFGKSQKSAPSAEKILGTVSDVNSITMSEADLLTKQIKDYAKGAKNTKAALVKASTQLTKEIKELVGTGKITVKQAANVLRRFSNVNLFSEKSIAKFVEYMTKVFNNAEYANQISIANKAKKAISALSRNKDKNANLRALAKQFLELDPSLIEDIYAYNEKAAELKNALEGSKMKAGDVNFAQTINIESLSDYINKNLEAQKKMLLEEKIAEIQELMGLDASDFTEAEINALLQEDKEIKKSDEVAIKDTIKRMFNVYSTLIKETISSGVDPFTGEPRTFTQKQQDLINRFMEMNLNNLDAKQSLAAVDSLINFFQNDSTARMEAVLSEYTGRENARILVEKGIKSIPLSKWFMKSFGRGLAKQTYNLNILFERMFKGVKSGAFVEKMSGVTNLINKKAYAQAQSNAITNEYVAEFFKQEANGEAFNTSANNAERGISAFLQRNVIGTEEEIAEDFKRRKELVEKTISDLANGNEKEQTKSEIYAQAYEKFKDAQNVQDVIDATDEVNLKAIQFWQNKWAEKYDDLADVSLNVYNKVLERDSNYTPDKFVRLSLDTDQDVNIANNESTFHSNNGTLYKKETGVLQKAIKPTAKNTKNVMDFSFDKNNANSMYDALIDMNTAAAIRQVEAFLKSDDFKKVFNADDAKLLIDRIDLYVKNIRKKNTYSKDDLSKLVKGLNKVSAIGVSQALSGPTQALKQVGPVIVNTLINAGAVDLKSSLQPDFLDFLKNSGYAIAVRGIDSQGSIDSISKIIKEESKGFGNKSVDYIMKQNEKILKLFLVRPDVFIARASWKSYYEKSLTEQGIDVKGLDYSKHQINEEAANYAQKMVDRQQNISDADMAGNLFTNKTATNQILMKIFMPFASFRMNQAARLGSDLNVLTSPLSTKEDKKIAALSLVGFSAEMAAFKILSTYIGVLLGDFTRWLMDDDEDEEERKKRVDSIIKGQATSSVTDVLSPLPVLDPYIQYGASWITSTAQDILETEDEEKVSLYEPKPKDMAEQFGLLGIPFIRAKQLWDVGSLAYDGIYTDSYGKEKEISEENQDFIKKIFPVAMFTTFFGPVEANTIVRDAVKFAKRSSTSTSTSESSGEGDESGGLTKSQLKRYFPARYERLYGKSSPGYNQNELLRDRAKRLADKKRELLDARYGYKKED